VLYSNWREFFTHNDDYFEFLLGDPGYVGEEMFIMRRIGRREHNIEMNGREIRAFDAFNAMHAGFRVQVEWGIGSLKCKWRRFMKRFNATRSKFPHLFRAAATLTNFIHCQRMDTRATIGAGDGTFGWGGDCKSISCLFLS